MDEFQQDDEEPYPVPLVEIFARIPLFDEVYLRMQSYNIATVDQYLYVFENETFYEWNSDENDRLPIERVMLLSALSQLWVFGFYELLRTWRGSMRNVISYGERLIAITDPVIRAKRIQQQKDKLKKANPKDERRYADTDYDYLNYGLVENDLAFLKKLKQVMSRIEPFFQRVELVRVALAKHEIHNAPGMKAPAPGYARMDRDTGSLMWPVYDKDGSLSLVTRREIANELRALFPPEQNPSATEASV